MGEKTRGPKVSDWVYKVNAMLITRYGSSQAIPQEHQHVKPQGGGCISRCYLQRNHEDCHCRNFCRLGGVKTWIKGNVADDSTARLSYS